MVQVTLLYQRLLGLLGFPESWGVFAEIIQVLDDHDLESMEVQESKNGAEMPSKTMDDRNVRNVGWIFPYGMTTLWDDRSIC